MERLYVKEDNESGTNSNRIMSIENKRTAAIIRLNNLCQVMFLEYGCWHVFFEIHSSNPFIQSNSSDIQLCVSMCPHCDGSMKSIVKTVSRKGIETFLSNVFIENNEGDLMPMQLSKKLYEFPNAGRLIYCRQSAIKPEKAMDASITILQLLCGNILKLKIDEGNKPKAVVTLSLTNSCPNYFNDSFWMYIRHYP